MLKINKTEMEKYGFNFDTLEDVYFYMKNIIEHLESHNKNYTKDQYYKISILKDIMNMIDVG